MFEESIIPFLVQKQSLGNKFSLHFTVSIGKRGTRLFKVIICLCIVHERTYNKMQTVQLSAVIILVLYSSIPRSISFINERLLYQKRSREREKELKKMRHIGSVYKYSRNIINKHNLTHVSCDTPHCWWSCLLPSCSF